MPLVPTTVLAGMVFMVMDLNVQTQMSVKLVTTTAVGMDGVRTFLGVISALAMVVMKEMGTTVQIWMSVFGTVTHVKRMPPVLILLEAMCVCVTKGIRMR
jgi:hypothetical protein